MNTNWRQRLALCLLPMAVILFFVLKAGPEEKIQKGQARKIASTPMSKAKKPLTMKTVMALKKKNLRHDVLRNRIPQSVEESFEKDSSITLSRGHDFLKDVGAVPLKQYQQEMGEIIQKTEHLVFFRTQSGHSYMPVALSRNTNNLYPISNIVHVKKVSPSQKENLLAEGFKLYYYHERLQFLSLKGESGKVLDLYQDLVKKGLEVQLEVLKPGPEAH